MPWRGRGHRVYIKNKPHKYGIKLYELCDSKSGFVCDFEVMCGVPNLSNKPFDVVDRLIDPLKGRGHTLYCDNYYTNPALADHLAEHDTMLVGTVRANRIGLPADLHDQRLRAGDMIYRRRDRVMVVKWKDKRDVMVITTKHLPEMDLHVTRTGRRQKPTAVIDYTKNMGGVDLSDQLIAYTPLRRKTVKWWKKLAMHFFSLLIVQGYILFKGHRPENRKATVKDYLKKIVHGMAFLHTADTVLPQVPDNNGHLTRLSGRHFLINSDTRVRCGVCYARHRKNGLAPVAAKRACKKTTYRCSHCGDAFCVTPCFLDFHTKKKYL